MGDMGGLLKFIMVIGSFITAVVSGTQFQAALIQAIYHIQNYSADQTEYYTSKFGANAMQLTEESDSSLSSSSLVSENSKKQKEASPLRLGLGEMSNLYGLESVQTAHR